MHKIYHCWNCNAPHSLCHHSHTHPHLVLSFWLWFPGCEWVYPVWHIKSYVLFIRFVLPDDTRRRRSFIATWLLSVINERFATAYVRFIFSYIIDGHFPNAFILNLKIWFRDSARLFFAFSGFYEVTNFSVFLSSTTNFRFENF